MRDRELIIETLINKMFQIAGHPVTYSDIIDRTDDWFTQWTMTEEQNHQWKKWGIQYLKKKGGILKLRAEKEMAMIDLNYGLKINKENENS